MGEVLDSVCSPSNLEEEELFDEKQKLAHSVFNKILLTDKGKAVVCQHEDDYNI